MSEEEMVWMLLTEKSNSLAVLGGMHVQYDLKSEKGNNFIICEKGRNTLTLTATLIHRAEQKFLKGQAST